MINVRKISQIQRNEIMKVAIFGADGRTGTYVVDETLEAGYEVVAYVQFPDRLKRENSHLRIIKGTLTDSDSIDLAINGVDAVISVLGPSSNNAVFEISSGMERILSSMKAHGVRRIIATAGAGVSDPDDRPTIMSKFMNWLVQKLVKNVYEDMVRTVEMVRASGLDWTIVRVPTLTDHPKAGETKVGWVGKGMGRQVTRADLVEFLVQQIEDQTYLQKAPVISIGKYPFSKRSKK
jgi:putative NADH-flavin reductase